MDTVSLRRLLRLAFYVFLVFGVGLLLAGPVSAASADFPRPGGTWTNTRTGGPYASIGESEAAVLASYMAETPSCTQSEMFGHFFDASGEGWFQRVGTSGNPSFCAGGVEHGRGWQSCPVGSAVKEGDVSQCTCAGGNVWNGSACGLDCPVGQESVETMFWGWDTGRTGVADQLSTFGQNATAGNWAACIGSCRGVSPNGTGHSCFDYPGAPTKIYCQFTFALTGEECVGGEPTPGAPDTSSPCPPGQTMGTVNGIPRCLASGTPSVPTTPAPRQSQQERVRVDNGDGTTTTTETTTGSDGSQTIRVTTRDGDGRIIGQTVTNTPAGAGKGQSGNTEQANFCRDNPDSPMCRPICEQEAMKDKPICTESTWGGACDTAFLCGGDPVQCAQAQAAWQLHCELTRTSDVATLGNQVLAGEDPALDSLPSPANAEVIEIGTLSASPKWTAECPEDMELELPGDHTLTIPFSELCWLLELLGYVNLIGTLLVCSRIVGFWGGLN